MAEPFKDHEVLFVSLVLVLGEPPVPPIGHTPDTTNLKYAHGMQKYARQVKEWMKIWGHNPHMGLYTEYMHWCKENWHGQTKT